MREKTSRFLGDLTDIIVQVGTMSNRRLRGEWEHSTTHYLLLSHENPIQSIYFKKGIYSKKAMSIEIEVNPCSCRKKTNILKIVTKNLTKNHYCAMPSMHAFIHGQVRARNNLCTHTYSLPCEDALDKDDSRLENQGSEEPANQSLLGKCSAC